MIESLQFKMKSIFHARCSLSFPKIKNKFNNVEQLIKQNLSELEDEYVRKMLGLCWKYVVCRLGAR